MNDEQQIIEPVPTMAGYKKIPTFKLWIANQFPYIETDFDAITNYELLQAVIKYLNTIIDNENNVESNVTALYNAFVNLHDYVENYFDNLDVQDEINNKLDEMAQDGTLEQLIFFNNIIYVTRPGHNLEPMNFNDTDETQKFQAIIDWALQNNGAKIMLPTGSTKISSININGNGALNIEIIGMGESTKIKSITNSNQKMFNVEASENGQIDYFSIKNLSLIKDENVSTNVTGIYLNKVCNNCSIENLYIKGFDTGLETYKCWTLKILNNNFYRNNLFGIKIGSETHNCTIYGNKISYNNDIGIKISSSYEINLENNDIEDNDGYGIVLNNTREMNIFKNYIENNGISNINSFSEIFIESNTIKTNILYNFINCNSALNCIIINPVSNNINISNNTFTGGDENKKIIKCNATATTQIQGNFTNNIYGSFTSPFDFGQSQFIIEYYNNNKILKATNKTIYNELTSNDGSYIIRTGQNGEIKFELNYNSSGEPIISIATGTAGSEVYKKILTLMADLNLLVRKSISFETKHSNTEIDENNCLFVATNGELRFKDMNGNFHTIVSIT